MTLNSTASVQIDSSSSAGILYRLIRYLLRVYFHIHSPKLRFFNPKTIPCSGPLLVILSSSHKLSDVLALATIAPRLLYWAGITRHEAKKENLFFRLAYWMLGLRVQEKYNSESMSAKASIALQASEWVVVPVDPEVNSDVQEAYPLESVDTLLQKLKSQTDFKLMVHLQVAHFS